MIKDKKYCLENLVEEINGIVYTEQWKDIKNYEGHYRVSDFGRVKSLKGNHKIRRFGKNGKDGYPIIDLWMNDKYKTFFIHLLVWDHFGNGQRNGRVIVVDHIDDIKANCKIFNLQLLTIRENTIKGLPKNGKLLGVSKVRNKWRSEITINNKRIHLGYWDSEQQGHQAYLDARLKYTV